MRYGTDSTTKKLKQLAMPYISTHHEKSMVGFVGMKPHCMPYEFLPLVVIQIDNHNAVRFVTSCT